MTKKISYLVFRIIYLFNFLLEKIFKKNLLIYFKEFLEENSYKDIIICKKKVIFFIPNAITKWRVESFYSKEPETLEWIDKFNDKKKILFWDIGANIGLYSIYNTLKNQNSTTISFEPSSSNLRVLTRNISINNLEKKVKILPLPLTNIENSFQEMNEGQFIEGGALNTFGKKFNFEGKEFEPKMKYSVLGTSVNYLIENKILEIPDYIKIDVDGIEHLILEGGNKVFNNKKIKSFSIEINENFKEQFDKVIRLMNEFGFQILHKKHNEEMFSNKSKFNKVFNYIFIR